MRKQISKLFVIIFVVITLSFVTAHPVAAASGSLGQVDTFIRNIIKLLAGLAGLVATGFFVVGGFRYITSSGNPEHLDKAKRTLLYSGIGLVIVTAAFVISNIITDLATSAFGG